MRSSYCKRSKNQIGTAAVELVCALIVMIPLMLLTVDLWVLYNGAMLNWRICFEAARAAAAGTPDAIEKGAPKKRATEVAARYMHGKSLQDDLNCITSERLSSPLPNPVLGGPVSGTTEVITIMVLRPPFIIGGIFGNRGVAIRDKRAFPIAYVVHPKTESVRTASIQKQWTVTIKPKLIKSYITYQGSRLDSIVSVSVFTSRKGGSPELYEDIYYAKDQVIGMRRYDSLNILDGTDGNICVLDDSDQANASLEGAPLANAVARTILDLSLNHSNISELKISSSLFASVIDDLADYEFYRAETCEEMGRARRLILDVVSDPEGLKCKLIY